MSRTSILWHFDESETQLLASDGMANMLDLSGDSGSTPALVIAPTATALLGYGRSFDGADEGLQGKESVAGSSLHARDVTIEAIVQFDIANAAAGPSTIMCRGVGGSAAERKIYGLELEPIRTNTHSLVLDLTPQYASITAGSQTGLDFTGDICLECWVYLETETNVLTRLIGNYDGTTGYALVYDKFSSELSLDIRESGGGGTGYAGTWNPSLKTWYHVAATRDQSAGVVNLYVDGAVIAAYTGQSTTAMAVSTGTFYIGYESGTPSQKFDGRIDDARVWNVFRSAGDINANKDQALLGTESGLAAYWKFDNNALDETSNNNDLTLTGSPSYSTSVGWGVVTNEATLRMIWEESDGTDAQAIGKDFVMPSSGYVYVWAARRWVSTTEAIVEYGVNGIYLGQTTNALADIGNGTDGTSTVGCEGDGSGNYQNFFKGTIDCIRVSPEARSKEELRQEFRRFAIHEPTGYDIVNTLAPSGDAYTLDGDSAIQRSLMVEGDGIGHALSKIAELREDGYPDTAHSLLDRWETITQLNAPGRTIAERRAAILSHLRTTQGYTVGKIKDALAEVFDLAAASVSILEYQNTYAEDFAQALNTQGSSTMFWGQFNPSGTVNVTGGNLVLALATATDGRWPGERTSIYVPMDDNPLYTGDDQNANAECEIKLVSSTMQNDTMAGIVMSRGGDNSAIFLGVDQSGGTQRIVRGEYSPTTNSWTISNLESSPTLPVYLRMIHMGDSDNDGTSNFALHWGTSANPTGGVLIEAAFDNPDTLSIAHITRIAAPSGGQTSNFDDFTFFNASGRRVFNWYAYRDPALAGSPDMSGAEQIVSAIKPAHTEASAVQTKLLLCDTDDNYCDHGPIGA